MTQGLPSPFEAVAYQPAARGAGPFAQGTSAGNLVEQGGAANMTY